MERNDAIAWGLATFVWLGALALFIWLAARERRQLPAAGSGSFRIWIGGRVAAGLAIWAVAFGGARWLERRLEQGQIRQREAPAAVVPAARASAEIRPSRTAVRSAEASRGPTSARGR